MRKFYPSNRKKIRGWKRRIKQIDAWGEWIKSPDIKYFNDTGSFTYERCILYPFYRLEKRQPPLWFYKLIISKFIAAYDEWEKVFDDLGIAHDLQIQLYDPAYMWSEIICRKVENRGDKVSYSWESDMEKPFPYDKFGNDTSYLKRFEWLLHDEELVIFESELEEENMNANDLLADGYVIKDSEKNGLYYAKKIGDIWIGRRNLSELTQP